MSTKKYTETRDHLRLWLERSQQAADAAPTVQQYYEDMAWVVRTLERRPAEAAGIPSSQLDENANSVYQRVTSNLPMIPQVDPTGLTLATASTVPSTAEVVNYVENVARLETPETKQFASESLTEYRQLQESHQRSENVRARLEATLPAVVPKFDSARDAYQKNKSGHGTETAAALEMRTFLDGLKGELFERARHRPKENMTFVIAHERLFSSAPTRVEVRQQFSRRPRLYADLSEMAKRLGPSPPYDLDTCWMLVLDHALIVVSALN